MMILEGIGFDPDGWRLDVAPHPFAQALGRGDVRVTTRYDLHDFAGAYFGALHEFGHGLYEAQIPERLGRSPLGSPVSLGVHESQSRLWENLVGRSRAFCTWVAPRLTRSCPATTRSTGGALPPREHRPPQPDPGRGGRDDVQPAHRPALRARAGAGRGAARRRRPPARVEPGHARAARPRRARRRPGRAPGRALGRRDGRLLPDVHAGQPDGRAALGGARRGDPRHRRRRSSGATSRRCGMARPSASTPRAGGSHRPSCCAA